MVFDKNPLQIRMNTNDKELCQQLGSEVLRRVLELNTRYYYSDTNLKVASLENDINDINDRLDKLIADNEYYNKRIKKNKEDIKKYKKILKVKEKELNNTLDIKNKQSIELDNTIKRIKQLITENNFNELEIQEIIENKQYCTTNQIIENIIIYLKKNNSDVKYIDTVENCRP